ncbi:class I SAM-dependent methyltransferase [bacterium]|nr:MAG: class I SAM-dependent methyltransferase [bacterium]
MNICVCGETRHKHTKTHATKYGPITIASCLNCGLNRDIKEYDYNFLYTDQANIYHPSDSTAFQEEILVWKRYLEFLQPYIGGSGRILDVGCNDGSLLSLLRDHGWSGIGIEMNTEMAKFATSQGLEVINKPFNQAPFADNSFDLIVMSHILEHMPDLGETLKRIRKLLRAGGYLLVIVPNYGCHLVRLIEGIRWIGFIPGQHIWYFTKKSLKSSCESFGLKLVEYRTINFLPTGSKVFLGSLIKHIFNFWMKITDNGEEISGLFQKPV